MVYIPPYDPDDDTVFQVGDRVLVLRNHRHPELAGATGKVVELLGDYDGNAMALVGLDEPAGPMRLYSDYHKTIYWQHLHLIKGRANRGCHCHGP